MTEMLPVNLPLQKLQAAAKVENQHQVKHLLKGPVCHCLLLTHPVKFSGRKNMDPAGTKEELQRGNTSTKLLTTLCNFSNCNIIICSTFNNKNTEYLTDQLEIAMQEAEKKPLKNN
jgi:hypothetical protein